MSNLFVGNNIIRLTETASTNSYAMALLKDVKPPEGTVIITENQTAGKGMRGNVWLSETGVNITCSVIFYPKYLTASNHFFLSKVVANAIKNALTELLGSGNYDIKIKWPNDILVNTKKIAGVLIENVFREDQIVASVVGIGLNVNQKEFGELENKACSMAISAGHDFDKLMVWEKLSKAIEVQYLLLMQGKVDLINSTYLNNMLFNGQWFDFVETVSFDKLTGKIMEVGNDGKLHMKLDTGEQRVYELKEIKFGY